MSGDEQSPGSAGAPKSDDVNSIAALVRSIGDAARLATAQEIERLRRFFADAVLPPDFDPSRGSIVAYLLQKYDKHVLENEEWPAGTAPEAYLQSLAAAVRAPTGGVRFCQDVDFGNWSLIFVVPSKEWEGAAGGPYLVVIFNGERAFWITGFQPESGLRYVTRQGGFWARRPG